MAPQKETLMVLKVDLDCYRCYTKVKRTLCCYPQIQDQIYNEKQNTVTIKVVCCTPEKIRDKILAKAGKSIKGIQILELKKPAEKPAEKPVEKPAEKPASKPKEEDKPQKQAQAPPPAEKPKDASPKPPADNKPPEMKKNGSKNGSKNGGPAPAAAAAAKPDGPAPAAAKPKDEEGGAPKKKPAEQAAMVHMMHPSEMIQCYPGYPINAGYQGNGYGYGYGFGAPPPPPPPPVQDGGWGYYGGGAPNGYGYGYEYNKPPANGYGDYISDENPTGCVVM